MRTGRRIRASESKKRDFSRAKCNPNGDISDYNTGKSNKKTMKPINFDKNFCFVTK
jgi:hypothetical protein